MTDYLGNAPIPVSAPTLTFGTSATTEAFSDPGLKVLADFLRSVIQYEVGTAWAATFGSSSACYKAYPHDPREEMLESQWLPALFCWRGSSAPTSFEDGNVGALSTVMCFWVFPNEHEQTMAAMAPSLQGLSAALVKALHVDHGNGRHPSYIIAGDTDPYAATYGSSILDNGGFWWANFDGDIRYSDVSFATDSRGQVSYQALFWQLQLREHYVPGTPDQRGVVIQMSIEQPGDDPVFTQLTGAPSISRGFSLGFSPGFG